jgi:hypothetical protein
LTTTTVRVRSVDEVTRAAADAIREHLIFVAEGDCAWVSGSTFDGLGHGTSDVDVFVATPQIRDDIPVTRRHAGFSVHAFIEGATRFDVEYWELPAIGTLVHRLASMNLDDPDVNLVNYFSRWETEFVHRLFIGVPLVNRDAVERIRGSFDRSRLARYVYDTALHLYDNAYDDCVGMLEAGQLEGAAIQARSVAGHAIDALLAACGSTSGQEKFRAERLRRLLRDRGGDPTIFATYWAVETRIPTSTDALDAYIRETLAYSERALGAVQDAVAARRHADGERRHRLLDEIPAGLVSSPQAVGW